MPATPEPPDVKDLLQGLPLVPAPETLWDDIQAALKTPVPARPLLRRPLHSKWLIAAAVVLAVVGGTGAGILRLYGAPSRWAVSAVRGAPWVDGAAVGDAGALAAGEWLVTDSLSTARLKVGRIGTAQVGPGSRVRLDRDGLLKHRLTLERGALDASITAPPRLFFVQTPAALATDLGCAYRLEVDSTGASRIHVTAGWVELRQGAAVSLVPAGLVAEVEVGGRPGTPYPEMLPEEARVALRRLDSGRGDAADLDRVIAALHTPADYVTFRRESAITLWHLLQRVPTALREPVYRRLTELSPPPARVTRDGLLALDQRMLDRWRADLHPMWSEEARSWPIRIVRRIWEWLL